MPFIGIISDEKSENEIKRKLIEKLKVSQNSIFFIKEKSIDNIKNIKFETVLLAREFKNIQSLKKLLKNTKYLIVNSDLKNNLFTIDDLKLTVITYGFNSKASLTVSSVSEDNILLCLQRNMIDIKGNIIEPQEIEVFDKEQINIVMGITAILLLYGKII